MSEHKNPFPGENNTGHFWDDEQDLRELNNRPPRWYMQSMLVGLVAIVIYSFYYPSIPWFGDHYKGSAGWTQITEMKESVAQLEEYRERKFAATEQAIADSSLEDIVRDDELRTYSIKTAKTLFGDNCAACHGAGGQGNDGFPVLADDDWLYGGSLAKIEQTIKNGRKGNMPARMLGITDAQAAELATFLIETGKGAQGNPNPASKALYFSKGCIGCHGPTLKGNQMLGSANLSDGIYRFKAEDQHASVVRTILHGVNNPVDAQTQNAIMPAFGHSNVIDAVQLKKLVIYVHQLGGGDPVKPAPKKVAVSKDAKYAPVIAKSDSFADVIAAAEANYKKNVAQNSGWRDTGKLIKEAKKTKDASLAARANTQAVNALRQASVAVTAGPRF
ncbi:MAG TPA: cytochrome-c oxidase, cbb3-type subunit III [Candidatus Thioglobus sp.]|jgi:cytochrome c oxidase cbb3-type subunit 3|nr:cytochrome-c oxidase, cbb3-type subunit III [Candidatus Thioglobus sp.]HIB31465.1 cytochrome-c oxidase, cbb3-type subunit III [Candidatus Thioglobus sp.]HIB97020.1 cytochrome-c oxidase, cbb3-type subunit III [Candidatus Thioglobus sp.]